MTVGPVWEQDAAGSNPVTRTNRIPETEKFRGFLLFFEEY